MKKDLRFFCKLFTSTFTLSAFTFGGGYVIIPMMPVSYTHLDVYKRQRLDSLKRQWQVWQKTCKRN